ncbi:MAG: hypothetical protein KDI48_16110 [Xanthomonadales bacterium]|nr:hypothetical protein [Xanthomonadales bacterium]
MSAPAWFAPIARRLPGPRWLVIGVPFIWMLLFFAVPFAIALKISFSKALIAMPPYSPVVSWEGAVLTLKLNFDNYLFLVRDSLYVNAYLSSLKIAVISTLGCLLIGYPMAYAIARMPPSTRNVALTSPLLPRLEVRLPEILVYVENTPAAGTTSTRTKQSLPPPRRPPLTLIVEPPSGALMSRSVQLLKALAPVASVSPAGSTLVKARSVAPIALGLLIWKIAADEDSGATMGGSKLWVKVSWAQAALPSSSPSSSHHARPRAAPQPFRKFIPERPRLRDANRGFCHTP